MSSTASPKPIEVRPASSSTPPKSSSPSSSPPSSSPSSSAASSAKNVNNVNNVLAPVKTDPLANIKPVQYSNPWDFVPDQPVVVAKPPAATTTTSNNNNAANVSIGSSNCDSSSGVSSASANSNKQEETTSSSKAFTTAFSSRDDWSLNNVSTNGNNVSILNDGGGPASLFDVKWEENDDDKLGVVATDKQGGRKDEFWSLDGSGILDDPFDAEWAALATRNNTKNVVNVTTNPFIASSSSSVGVNNSDNNAVVAADPSTQKSVQTFEIQM